jgi:hypothetical protein
MSGQTIHSTKTSKILGVARKLEDVITKKKKKRKASSNDHDCKKHPTYMGQRWGVIVKRCSTCKECYIDN